MIKMSAVRFLSLFFAFTMFFIGTRASNHWMVTESGLIQPKLDSPFNMARPYDFLAFLNQEKRLDNIFEIYTDMSSRQKIIDNLWDNVERNTKIGVQVAQGKHCVKAGNVHIIDWYTALLEDGSKKVPKKEFSLPVPYYGPDTDIPDCKKISSLTFSMFAFEHLDSMIQRDNLTANPEFALPELISPVMTLDQFGHWLTMVLHRNTSSWLYYHMASLYWRVRGNAPKAIECSRRALHYAPRQYKDIALGSLGMVLHRSGKTDDAITVLHAAVDHDPNNYVSNFAIANAYTVLGEFNTSVKYYDKTLKLNPRMELAAKHRSGTLCHAKLTLRLNSIKEIFNNLSQELQAYTKVETSYLKMQGELLGTIKHSEPFDYRDVDKTFDTMSDLTGLNLNELKVGIGKNTFIRYLIEGVVFSDVKLGKGGVDGIHTVYSLDKLISHINTNINEPTVPLPDKSNLSVKNKEKVKHSESNAPKPVTREDIFEHNSPIEMEPPPAPDEELSEFETGIFMYPSTLTVNRDVEDFDTEEDWPSNKLCKESGQEFPENVEALYPIFLPFENKGIRMKALLTDKLGVPLSEEHELPWHPPSCDAAPAKKTGKPQFTAEVIDTGYLRQKLLEYVSDGKVGSAAHMQDAEIGHRIYVAMKKKLAPRWVLLTLSSLYWRVRGQAGAALGCLRAAARAVRPRYRDLVLVSQASVLLEMGLLDDALVAAHEAFRINFYEPATNLLIAELSMLGKHRNMHIFHLKQVARVESGFMGGVARRLLLAWSCILRQVVALQEFDFGEGDICTHVQPLMDLICKDDEANCEMPNIQCYKHDTSALVRMLDGSPNTLDVMDKAFFDTLVENTPIDRGERLAHHANFDSMVITIDTVMKGCGRWKCSSLKPEDLDIKEEDCNYQNLQLSHWLHVVSFKQLLADTETELSKELSLVQVTGKKIPECRLTAELDDFYLEKISRVDTEGWKPVLSLMNQLSEIFHHNDFSVLGSKIAKYVEMRPRWWVGLAAAGWWCGASGRGPCAVRCLAAAHRHAPAPLDSHPLRSLAALLHMQSKQKDAKQISYLSFYTSPKSKIEAFLVAVAHAYMAEYEQAIWMFRYSLTFDENFVPAKACLHATMCLMFFGEGKIKFVE